MGPTGPQAGKKQIKRLAAAVAPDARK